MTNVKAPITSTICTFPHCDCTISTSDNGCVKGLPFQTPPPDMAEERLAGQQQPAQGPVDAERDAEGGVRPSIPVPTMPSDKVKGAIAFLKRVPLEGDEAYAYVSLMEYLRNQQALHQRYPATEKP